MATTLMAKAAIKLNLHTVDDDHLLTDSVLSRYTPFSDDTTPSVKSDTAIFHCEQVQPESLLSCFDRSVPVVFARHFIGGDPFDRAHYDDEYGEIQEEHGRVLGEISAIASLLFSAQHRLFLFMILIIGRRFRLLRLDRAGIVVSAPVNYISDPDALCDALQRLCALDDSSLGLDQTVTRVLPGDHDFRRMDIAALKSPQDTDHSERDLNTPLATPITFAYTHDLFDASIASGWLWYQIQVQNGDTWRDFLVGKPTFRTDGVVGRGTRGYIALDCETNCFVWLKDVWRAAYAIAVPEGDMLWRLNDAGVENVPMLVCHGDVDDHVTITADYWEPRSVDTSTRSQDHPCSLVDSPPSDSRKRKRTMIDEEDVDSSWSRDGKVYDSSDDSNWPLRQHKHYRMVVEEVAFPLTHFKNGKQLASLVLDALQAHYQAANHPRMLLLHRDISTSNILLYPQVQHNDDSDKAAIVWTGLLCDWELAKPVDHRRSLSAVSSSQMGTYQFKSINLLRKPWRPTQISDELESFFYVLLQCSVRHLCSNCSCPTSWIDNFFNEYGGPGGPFGWKCMAVMVDDWLNGWFPHRLLFHSPMDDVLRSLLECFHAHYKVSSYDMMIAQPLLPTPDYPPSDESIHPVGRPDIVFFDNDGKDGSVGCDDGHSLSLLSLSDDDTPITEDRELAAQIFEHKFMLDKMEVAIQTLDWPEEDCQPSPEYRKLTPSAAHTSEASRAAHASNKKQRTSS
ncbi:hypothetical protein V8D89_004739 [Ganoderma adspersum]